MFLDTDKIRYYLL